MSLKLRVNYTKCKLRLKQPPMGCTKGNKAINISVLNILITELHWRGERETCGLKTNHQQMKNSHPKAHVQPAAVPSSWFLWCGYPEQAEIAKPVRPVHWSEQNFMLKRSQRCPLLPGDCSTHGAHRFTYRMHCINAVMSKRFSLENM